MQRRQFLAASSTLPLWACDPPHDLTHVPGGFAGVAMERGHAVREPQAWPAPSRSQRTRVLIVGGGIAGLAAARALRLRGVHDLALLELEDEAGGNSRGLSLHGLPCPLGAHYLPVPGDDAPLVQDLLEELGLRQRLGGRWVVDERHLCHSPQERLFFQGHWQEGLLPVQGVGARSLDQYRRFGALVEQLRQAAHWQIPATQSAPHAMQLQLDQITLATWLAQQGLDDPHLRWYLDYCCRDDYGAGAQQVSAWAGLHYFASRHGFHAPGDADTEPDAVLTWPQGNAWLSQRLAQPLLDAGQLHLGQIVLRVTPLRQGVEVDCLDAHSQTVCRWQAQHCVLALPLHVASRVVQNPPDWLKARAASVRHAPWVVVNAHLKAPLADHPGAAPSWDNVLYGSSSLGYVNATHQSLARVPGATVLTWYQALGDLGNGRQQLAQRPWTDWRDALLADLAQAHPDLPQLLSQVAITRHGHGMAIPTPGSLQQVHQTLRHSAPHPAQGRLNPLHPVAPQWQRLHFAHSDWAGYSVFEEAFTLGHAAGEAAFAS